MTTLVMRGGDPQVLLSHLALYGLGAILENAGLEVRLGWTVHSDPRPELSGVDETEVGEVVRAHAGRLAAPDSWLAHNIELKGAARGLMSPRLTPFGNDDATWNQVQSARHRVLDELTNAGQFLDLRMIASLGEPAYWSVNRKGDMRQDDGASRLEMQPRNRGSEIVGSRLRKLSAVVAARGAGQVVASLTGDVVRDELGKDRNDSRTATGLANLGPTDNAIAWCALWGISQLPIAMRIGTWRRSGTARTSGHLGRSRREWFYAPIWHMAWPPARLRTILASAHLRTAAAAGLALGHDSVGDVEVVAAQAWLRGRHVSGVMRFPIERFGSGNGNARERRAMGGEALPLQPTARRLAEGAP